MKEEIGDQNNTPMIRLDHVRALKIQSLETILVMCLEKLSTILLVLA